MTEAEQKITSALERELEVVERECIRSLQVSMKHKMAAACYLNRFECSVVVPIAVKTRKYRIADFRGAFSSVPNP